MSELSTFKIGGPGALVVEAETESGLVALLRVLDRENVAFHVIGLGSNVLFPDGGLDDAIVRLGRGFYRSRFWGDRVTAGGGLALAQLAQTAARRGLVGIEALTGFPSSVGGAVYMNAGCYGTEISDVLLRATVVSKRGVRARLSVEDLAPGYRSSKLQQTGGVVTRVTLQLRRGNAAEAQARIHELNRRRWASLPSGQGNAGSIFKNPPGDHAGRLIEACGLKGLMIGGAQISPKHANVIVNLGGAKAVDVLELMLRASNEVAQRFGIELTPELVLIGDLRQRWLDGHASRL